VAHFTRREFLKTGLAAGTLAVSGAVPVRPSPEVRPTSSRWAARE
jgi:hypothetical protein